MEDKWESRLGFWWIAEDHPELPAVLASPSGTTLTFGELAARAHQVVHALRSRNISHGDAVAYALPNDVDVLFRQLALQEAGMHGISLNPSLSAAELERFSTTQAQLRWCSTTTLPNLNRSSNGLADGGACP